jgi:hypothetical protein
VYVLVILFSFPFPFIPCVLDRAGRVCRVKIKETVFNYGQKMSLFHTFYTVVLGPWSSVLASIDLRIVSFLGTLCSGCSASPGCLLEYSTYLVFYICQCIA